MNILMIDNYDSFTYNLVQYLEELGASVVTVRNDEASLSELAALPIQAVVISPGPCTPREAGVSLEAIGHFAGRLPLLGVCLGHQAIGMAFGGKLGPAKKVMHGKTDDIRHDGSGVFGNLPDPLTVVRYHSLALTSLPEPLIRTAWSDDGEIMGVRHRELDVEGVQFHPESIASQAGHQMLDNFLARVRKASPAVVAG